MYAGIVVAKCAVSLTPRLHNADGALSDNMGLNYCTPN